MLIQTAFLFGGAQFPHRPAIKTTIQYVHYICTKKEGRIVCFRIRRVRILSSIYRSSFDSSNIFPVESIGIVTIDSHSAIVQTWQEKKKTKTAVYICAREFVKCGEYVPNFLKSYYINYFEEKDYK